MRAQRQLLEHAASLMHATLVVAAGHVAQRLNMEMLLQVHVDVIKDDVFALDGEFAVVQSVRPFRMTVSETQHEEIVDRLECCLEVLRTLSQHDGGGSCM